MGDVRLQSTSRGHSLPRGQAVQAQLVSSPREAGPAMGEGTGLTWAEPRSGAVGGDWATSVLRPQEAPRSHLITGGYRGPDSVPHRQVPAPQAHRRQAYASALTAPRGQPGPAAVPGVLWTDGMDVLCCDPLALLPSVLRVLPDTQWVCSCSVRTGHARFRRKLAPWLLGEWERRPRTRPALLRGPRVHPGSKGGHVGHRPHTGYAPKTHSKTSTCLS